MKISRTKLIRRWLVPALLVVVYLMLRLVYFDSFTFEYDMPRLARVVQQYKAEGSFLTSQAYFEASHWDNVPWGPALVYFYYPLFLVSSETPIVGLLTTLVNALSIVLVYFLGTRYFSGMVGFGGALLLATQPYWVFFSRLIYQPTPVVTVTALIMLVTFVAMFEKRGAAALLPFLWMVAFQIYIPLVAVCLVSYLGVMLHHKKGAVVPFLVGGFFSLIVLLPSFLYFSEHPVLFGRYFETPSKFTPPQTNVLERVRETAGAFIRISAGGDLDWYLTYALEDYLAAFPGIRLGHSLLVVVLSFVFFVTVWQLVKRRFPAKLALLFLWASSPWWFFSVVWVSDLTPRYFLMGLPALCLLAVWALDGLWRQFLPSFWAMSIAVVVLVSLFWSYQSLSLQAFLLEYDYPEGRLGDIFETPYVFLRQSLDWVSHDAVQQPDGVVRISNFADSPCSDAQLLSTEYLLQYVYPDFSGSGDYLITYAGQQRVVEASNQETDWERFGPFLVTKQKCE